MKGLVLAGGKGSRLRPFTYSGAKQLVPVANKPILFYALEQLAEAGVVETGVIVGDTAAQIREAVGDGSRWGLEVTYIQQDQPLGIAHALLAARPFLGDDAFTCYLGDNFLKGGIAEHARRFLASGADAQVLLHPVPNPEDFGIAQLDGERLVRVVEKPGVLAPAPPGLGNLAVIGIYFLSACAFEVITAQRPSPRGELEISDTISGLLERGHTVVTATVDGYWIDTGKMDDILQANKVVLETVAPSVEPPAEGCSVSGVVRVEAGALLEDARLEGPCAVAAGATVRRSRVGPATSIGEGCLIEDCDIEGSIVMERSTVRGCTVRDSLIGRDVTVACSGGPFRLVLGDHSRLEGSPR